MENTKALKMTIKDIKSSTDLTKKIKFELGTVTITDLQGQKHMVDGYVGECFFAYAADLEAQLADAQAQLAAVREQVNFKGCFTGLYDRCGNKVYFGDILDFDSTEWGGPMQFEVLFDPSDIFRATDIKSWCTKITATRQPKEGV